MGGFVTGEIKLPPSSTVLDSPVAGGSTSFLVLDAGSAGALTSAPVTSPSGATLTGLAPAQFGAVVLSGNSVGDPAVVGSTPLMSNPGAFLSKIDSSFNVLWTHTITATTSASPTCFAVAIDSFGGIDAAATYVSDIVVDGTSLPPLATSAQTPVAILQIKAP
jgi:hypothetical protein